jgi:hypothetical protein
MLATAAGAEFKLEQDRAAIRSLTAVRGGTPHHLTTRNTIVAAIKECEQQAPP